MQIHVASRKEHIETEKATKTSHVALYPKCTRDALRPSTNQGKLRRQLCGAGTDQYTNATIDATRFFGDSG